MNKSLKIGEIENIFAFFNVMNFFVVKFSVKINSSYICCLIIAIIMNTAVIEIKNDIAYSLLRDLERINVLRIIKRNTAVAIPKQKLSERFSGCLSQKRTEELQQEPVQMRNEWNRDTY